MSEAASLALHTMPLLARDPVRRLTTPQIARALRSSEHHLAKVMQRLVKAGLVDSTRGPQGGFQIARPAGEIRLLDVYEAVEGPLLPEGCLLGEPVCNGTDCMLGDLVHQVQQQVHDYLSNTMLSELARKFAFIDSGALAKRPKRIRP
jgi:Rrf2 family protein